jgi:ATP-dependent DNA helicase 2 subunit 1
MVEKDQIAIVKIVPRKTSSVRFAALLPQIEDYDKDHFQTPAGFNMIFLPYADDMRKPDQIKLENINEPSEAQLAGAKLLINSISADIDCRNFENPAIQTFFTRLQAIALDEKKPEEVEDLLQPDEESLLIC